MAITLNDMIKCGQGDIIVSMMIDAKAFFDYDQRENGNTLEVYDDY
jgi:serine/threonine-protein phosphatase 2A regulatory subunit B''